MADPVDWVYTELDTASHKGYEVWHRVYDQKVVKWLSDNPRVTQEQFLSYMRDLYKIQELDKRFPQAWKQTTDGYRGVGMNKFYVIEPADGKMFGTKWAYAEPLEPSNIGKSQKCPVCGGAVSLRRWLPPHRIKLSSAKPSKWGDFVWGAGFPLLVSSKFKEIYDQERLTGIEEFSFPVEIVRIGTLKSGQFPLPPPTYHLIHVLWGGANQDDIASDLTHEHPEVITCAFCRVGVTWRKQERVIIEESSWNGSDIFKPRNAPVHFMVSERFKRLVENNHMSNIWLIPAEQFAYDERRLALW